MKARNLVSFLLILTSVLHFVAAASQSGSPLQMPLALFGVLYGALGFWTRKGARTAFMSTMIVAGLGLGLGAPNYLQNGGPALMPVMLAIDAIVIIGAGLWLRKNHTGGIARSSARD